MTELLLEPKVEEFEKIDISHLITEDDAPVDSIFSEKQMRLLTNALHTSWKNCEDAPQTFVAFANVGLFYTVKKQAIIPDVMVSLNVELPANVFPKRYRSYFIWEYGKPPDVVVEIVSNRVGGELERKRELYSEIGVDYYIVHDPERHLGQNPLRLFQKNGYGYKEMSQRWLPGVGLGLTLWRGVFEDMEAEWLRWIDNENNLLLTSDELNILSEKRANQAENRADQAQQRADQAQQRAERLAAKLRELGINPDD